MISEHRRESDRLYREANRERRNTQHREYRAAHPVKMLIHQHRYRARLLGLPDSFTEADWRLALDYFEGCCAVCGRQSGLWHVVGVDHWIPLALTDCPGTVPSNIIPLCHGIDGCNNSKRNKRPEHWLTEKFGRRKAAQIATRIEAYFKTVAER